MWIHRRMPWWMLAIAGLALVGIVTGEGLSQKQKADTPKSKPATQESKAKAPPGGAADELLKLGPRPKRDPLPPSQLPLEFLDGERIALIGNSTAERMNLFGYFETLLHSRFPKKKLVVRNFARPADEVALQQRPNDYTKLDDPIAAFGPDTFFCFFGWNESFAGPTAIAKFQTDYQNLLNNLTKKYSRDVAGSSPRFILITPMAFEPTANPLLPEGTRENENLKRYSQAVVELGRKLHLAVVDLFTPTRPLFEATPGLQYTINGCHCNEDGDRLIANILDRSLFGSPNPAVVGRSDFERLRTAVNDKSWIHQQDYRMINGWYVYGGRRTWDTETFPREYLKIRAMAAVRDRIIWNLASGQPVPERPDDSATGELFTPQTRFGEPRQKYSENAEGGPRILQPEELIKSCTVPPGFQIKLFADETRFPEIAKPVQLNFDSKGRLWVATMPSYPQWKPGDPRPADKLVILEDTDGDGIADKSKVFYDKLHCPTGFEFYQGGVLVIDQPRMLWLKDTDGDDVADVVVHLLDGWASDDTHHTVGAFEYNHGGLLHMLEGVAMSTAVETPWGPFRNFGSSGAYVFDPRTLKIRHFVTPGYGNPWCYVFNEWGQGFCGDGTGASQHWDSPLSGAQFRGRKGLNPVFPTEGMRPVVGSEFLVTRHFPEDVQGQFLYACVINTNGMPRWTFQDDGGGYSGKRVRHKPDDPRTAFDLIKSTDKHFRPVDPQIGPDGALWFGDWANPLIGHMQYSQRDPNRDHVHGRIYRLVYNDKPLLKPVTQANKTTAEVLNQLKEYEWRTRYRARRDLHDRPITDVMPELRKWWSHLDPGKPSDDRLRCEALWVQQGHHAVDPIWLSQVLSAPTPDARAAAVRILADERDRLPNALELLKRAALDPHPRVRTEACRGLSFFPDLSAANGVISALEVTPSDYFVSYTGEAALTANEAIWSGPFLKGELTRNPEVKSLLQGILTSSKAGSQVVPYLQILLGKETPSQEARNKSIQAIADLRGGNAENGKQVFRRNCIVCHKVFDEGADYGPEMMKVASRITRYKIVESIIDPNAEVDMKYLSTRIDTRDGKSLTGLVIQETDAFVELFDGKEKKRIDKKDIEERSTLKQSGMPDGLAGTIAPVEFLDVIEFLSRLK